MSTPALNPFFLRAYQVQVVHAGETLTLTDSTWEPEALRAKFVIDIKAPQPGQSNWWWGEVSIWNASSATEQTLLSPGATASPSASQNTPIVQGDLLTISAGYQATFNPQSNIVFKGNVLQPMWERENVTDFKTTLRAIINPLDIAFVSLTMGPYQTQASVIAKMAEAAHVPVEQIDTSALSTSQLPRSKAIFGVPSQVISQVARTNSLLMWVSPNGLNVRTFLPGKTTPDFVFGPSASGTGFTPVSTGSAPYTPTMIGTPQQTQEGVNFRVLMDSRVKLGSVVGINQSVIRQLPRYPGSAALSLLDQDGNYVVAGIRHIGDTRGEEWYTDITGVTYNFWQQYAPALSVAAGGAQ